MHKHLLVALLLLATAGGCASARGPLAPGPHEFDVDGVRLWYRVAGRGRGVPLVFLHGGPGQGSQAFQAIGGPQLERTQRIVYFDQRGAGRSDRPKDETRYSIEIMVEDIEHLRRHLGMPKVSLLGHSFGSQLALEYAAKYPQHTEAVVLAAATPHLARSIDLQCERLVKQDPEAYARARESVREGALPRCNTMAAYSGDAAKAFAIRNLFPDPAIAARVEELGNADGLRSTFEVSVALFKKGLLTYRFTAAEKVQAPVLVIAGGKDFQAALDVQRDLVRDLPNAKLSVWPEAGHFMFIEDPERFASEMAAFLRE